MKLSRVVLASGNAGKLRELAALLAPLGVELVAQSALGIGDAEEPHPSFVENALAKARHASAASGWPAIADDSGLCIEALDGAPGVRSARWASLDGGPRSDEANNAKLVATIPTLADRRAHYYCVLVLVRRADDPQPVIAEASWAGQVIDTPRGLGGFGYDPYFLVDGLGRTAAELDPAHKNRVSHRALAMQALLARLQERGLVEPRDGS